MFGRRSNAYFLCTTAGLLFVALMFAHGFYRQRADAPLITEKREMVRKLGLTDLCLFTDARYTRNPVMADLNTPFQDHPMSFEHFPSASLLAVPPHLARPQASARAEAKAQAKSFSVLASASTLASSFESVP